ncbi:BnaCnng73780D, partial [Brassica napus]
SLSIGEVGRKDKRLDSSIIAIKTVSMFICFILLLQIKTILTRWKDLLLF